MPDPGTNISRPKGTPTTSAVLDDGTIVEMVHRPHDRKTAFVTCSDGITSDEEHVDVDGLARLVPYSPDNNLLVHNVVLFPSAAAEYDSEGALLTQVRAFIHQYVDIPETFEEISAHYVLFSWIYDAFQEAPYLRVRGDYGSGKSRFLLAVGSLCYKPIFASGASTTSPIFRILDAFRGTLVIDESDFRVSDEKAEIVKILNNGNAVGFPVLRSEATPQKEYNPMAFNVFGPKIIASRNVFEDRALESRCITEEMGAKRPRPDIPLNLPLSFHDEARELRNKLLLFRFRNLQKSRDLAAARDPSVEPRIAQILAPLLATVEDPAVQERLRELGRQHSRDLAADRGLSIEAQVLEVVAGCVAIGGAVTVKDIAERFAAKHGAELARPVTPRWIGWVLRTRLGLPLAKTEAGFVLATLAGSRLRSLLEKYGLLHLLNIVNIMEPDPPLSDDRSTAS